MPDNPIHTFVQFLAGNIPDQLALGGLRWLTVVFYWALLAGNLSVAFLNWRLDPAQRTDGHVGTYVMRLLMAGMWTYVGIICAHGMFAASHAGRSLDLDDLLAKRLVPSLRYDGPAGRAIAFAS